MAVGITVEAYKVLTEHAYSGDANHSVLGNLANVTDDDWLWAPSPEGRTIADIVEHIGSGKYGYHSAMFGDGSYVAGGADQKFAAHPGRERGEMMTWLQRAHEMLLEGIAGLSDADLERPPRGDKFQGMQLQHLIYIGVVHDLYHAGELNHLRSIAQGNDRWGYFPEGSEG